MQHLLYRTTSFRTPFTLAIRPLTTTSVTMSWMDSWSRPGKRAAVPPPFYVTQGDNASYCHTCGRVMSSRKVHQAQSKVIKYCSDGCRHRKPGPLDRKIEKAIVALLNAEPDSRIEETAAASKMVKGDRRVVVTCDEIESIMFGNRHVQINTPEQERDEVAEEGKSAHLDTNGSVSDQAALPKDSRPERTSQESPPGALTTSDTNDSSGEGDERRQDEQRKMQAGQRRAEHREMVRRAARRGVVFGFLQEPAPTIGARGHGKRDRRSGDARKPGGQEALDPTRRKCEALMNGSVVEPSFAKGNWAIRWREDT